MKLSRILKSGALICLFLFSCNSLTEKPKNQPVPSTENKDLDEIKKTHREIDSIKSLKKKKSKRLDSLKPGVASLDELE